MSCTEDTSSDDSDKADSSSAPDKSAESSKPTKPAAPASDSKNNTESARAAASDPHTPLKDLPDECKGFEVLGLKNSPGGTTLPNTCAPFETQRNNPYAIRCIDANPDYKTKYAGDDLCILPPPPELGTQVHVGPDDYDDASSFELAAGAEQTRTFFIDASTDEDHYFYRMNTRVRRGAHHMVVSAYDMDRDDGWGDQTFDQTAPADGEAPSSGQTPSSGGFGGAGFGDLAGLATGNFGVQQRVDQDRPHGTLAVPPENQGLGGLFKAKQQMGFNLHYINTAEQTALREVWLNLWYMNKDEVTTKLQPLNIGGGNVTDVALPAKTHTVLTYQCDVANDVRLISLYGHRHAHTDRFSMWVKKASGETVTVYESFSWEDMPTYQYDSISTNPEPNVDKRIDGASSGQLNLEKGDQLFFRCDINNTLDTPLRFSFETINGEMCLVFGSYTGPQAPCNGVAKRVHE